jgi:hypothetical protein
MYSLALLYPSYAVKDVSYFHDFNLYVTRLHVQGTKIFIAFNDDNATDDNLFEITSAIIFFVCKGRLT